MKVRIANTDVAILQGDITEMDVDAVVNPANAQLVLGGGVAGAIRKKGGPSIQEECNRIGGTHVGGAVITGAGNLRARHVIHAVGPRMGEGDEDAKLRSATLEALRLTDKSDLKSMAFPAISTGIFRFPMDRCARIMIRTVLEYLEDETGLQSVLFCLFGEEAYRTFQQTLQNSFPNPQAN